MPWTGGGAMSEKDYDAGDVVFHKWYPTPEGGEWRAVRRYPKRILEVGSNRTGPLQGVFDITPDLPPYVTSDEVVE